jgi:glucosamine--fructose-6-phosphate aminotransferase (isomerizing)
MTSAMRETMRRQPADLRRLAADPGPARLAAERLRGRPVVIAGTGTSWHAAAQGAFLLRRAGVDARAVQNMEAVVDGPAPRPDQALVLMSHRGTKRYGAELRRLAEDAGVPIVGIGAIGAPGADVETVEPETSSAFTASHTGALFRLAQIAVALGADLGDLDRVPDTVAAALDGPGPGVEPPRRLIELTGSGINGWTAAEGALKIRETAYLATEGLPVEQLLHGPGVALGADDVLVALDGGGPGAERVLEVAHAAEGCGVPVRRVTARELGEPLSVFPLTVAVQRVALECAEALGTNPDTFRRVTGREAWDAVTL